MTSRAEDAQSIAAEHASLAPDRSTAHLPADRPPHDPGRTWRAGRQLVGLWRRWTRWEFWPSWAFYPPVVAWILWLGVKHRGMTTFTAANPGIPDGGFIGESKHAILLALAAAGDVVARHRRIAPAADPAEREAELSAFMAEHGLDYPIVLKPDVGQRGQGVRIVRDADMAGAYLAAVDGPVIAQEFAPGQEFGVFYVRRPDEPHGRIFSITEKVLPTLVGDGVRTLDTLILADARAVCMARAYRAANAARLHDVPGAGEVVTLVEIGTHARGAIFRDGNWANTPALEAAIDRVSKTFEGFYIGRYDLRTPSVADFMAGVNFRIVELNGVTAEATDIYDARNSVRDAWRTLRRQWDHAFAIGAANRARGASVTSLWRLMANVVAFEAVDDTHPA
ncbi:MAG: hypothetical protein ABI780_09135 [Ardenticatenales bacterium]